MSIAIQDGKYGLRKNPGITLPAVGIGANILILVFLVAFSSASYAQNANGQLRCRDQLLQFLLCRFPVLSVLPELLVSSPSSKLLSRWTVSLPSLTTPFCLTMWQPPKSRIMPRSTESPPHMTPTSSSLNCCNKESRASRPFLPFGKATSCPRKQEQSPFGNDSNLSDLRRQKCPVLPG